MIANLLQRISVFPFPTRHGQLPTRAVLTIGGCPSSYVSHGLKIALGLVLPHPLSFHRYRIYQPTDCNPPRGRNRRFRCPRRNFASSSGTLPIARWLCWRRVG